MDQLWTVMEPYILRERQIRRMGYMVFFEDLVVASESAILRPSTKDLSIANCLSNRCWWQPLVSCRAPLAGAVRGN
jgi:hypothetical protein